MKILEGLLTVNGVDIYKEYNVFLAEDSAGSHANYDELLKIPAMKASRLCCAADGWSSPCRNWERLTGCISRVVPHSRW